MLQKIQNRRGGFTLVEIMIVVAIIALLASIAVPSAMRARKRAQAAKCLDIVRQVDSAADQWAIENNKQAGDSITISALSAFVKTNSQLQMDLANSDPKDALGRSIRISNVDTAITLDPQTKTDLNSVVDSATFWGPY